MAEPGPGRSGASSGPDGPDGSFGPDGSVGSDGSVDHDGADLSGAGFATAATEAALTRLPGLAASPSARMVPPSLRTFLG